MPDDATDPDRPAVRLPGLGDELVVRRGVRTSWLPTVVVALVLATALAAFALARSTTGRSAPSLADGTAMACVQLADEGAFQVVEPGLAPVSASLRLDGSLRCVWPDGTVTSFHYIETDPVSETMLWSAVALTVAAVTHSAICTSRRFAVYDG